MSKKLDKTFEKALVATSKKSQAGKLVEMSIREKYALAKKLMDAAQRHGEQSAPDHEVGDLQQIISRCFEEMTASQVRSVMRIFTNLLNDWR